MSVVCSVQPGGRPSRGGGATTKLLSDISELRKLLPPPLLRLPLLALLFAFCLVALDLREAELFFRGLGLASDGGAEAKLKDRAFEG